MNRYHGDLQHHLTKSKGDQIILSDIRERHYAEQSEI